MKLLISVLALFAATQSYAQIYHPNKIGPALEVTDITSDALLEKYKINGKDKPFELIYKVDYNDTWHKSNLTSAQLSCLSKHYSALMRPEIISLFKAAHVETVSLSLTDNTGKNVNNDDYAYALKPTRFSKLEVNVGGQWQPAETSRDFISYLEEMNPGFHAQSKLPLSWKMKYLAGNNLLGFITGNDSGLEVDYVDSSKDADYYHIRRIYTEIRPFDAFVLATNEQHKFKPMPGSEYTPIIPGRSRAYFGMTGDFARYHYGRDLAIDVVIDTEGTCYSQSPAADLSRELKTFLAKESAYQVDETAHTDKKFNY